MCVCVCVCKYGGESGVEGGGETRIESQIKINIYIAGACMCHGVFAYFLFVYLLECT